MERTKKFVVLQKKKEHTKNISDLRFRFCCYNNDLIGGYYKVARQEFIV